MPAGNPEEWGRGLAGECVRALTAEDFRACVDKSREVTVDARVYFLRRAQIDDEEGDEDDHPRL
jgi:hypothetical protein